jgi:ribosomal RNA-processing protein 9
LVIRYIACIVGLTVIAIIRFLLFHQDKVFSVDCWNKDKPLTASMDRSVRLWNVNDGSHAVYRGHKGCIDAVQLLTEDSFLSCGEDGALCLWRDTQKKPSMTIPRCHGNRLNNAGTETDTPNWVSALATVKMSDVAFTGSNNGFINVWKASLETKTLENIKSIPVAGFVNSLAVSSIEPNILVAGLGREHKQGRWWNLKGNKDKVAIIRLPREQS